MALLLKNAHVIDPQVGLNEVCEVLIRDGKIIEKKKIDLPETLTDIIKCKNPRCISQTEQEIKHVFRLTDRENHIYRCLYCETKASI